MCIWDRAHVHAPLSDGAKPNLPRGIGAFEAHFDSISDIRLQIHIGDAV